MWTKQDEAATQDRERQPWLYLTQERRALIAAAAVQYVLADSALAEQDNPPYNDSEVDDLRDRLFGLVKNGG